MIWTYNGRDATNLNERVEFQRQNFAHREPYFPVSSFYSFDESLRGANDRIMTMIDEGREVTEEEETSLYAASLGLDPSLPWTLFGLGGTESDPDSIASETMTQMQDQMHRSTLETSYTARAFAERWSDPTWEDMKASFSSLRRQHLICECCHLRRHLRFSLVVRVNEGATDGFLLLQSSLRLQWDEAFQQYLLRVRQASIEPFPYTTDDIGAELTWLNCQGWSSFHSDGPRRTDRQGWSSFHSGGPRRNCDGKRMLIRRQQNRLRRFWRMQLVRQGVHLPSHNRPRSRLDGQRLVIRRKQLRLRLTRPSPRGDVESQTEHATGQDSTNVGLTDLPLKVDWTTCALHLSSTLSWKNRRLFIGGVEATVCLFIPAETPFYNVQSLCSSLPSLPTEFAPLHAQHVCGGTLLVCRHHQAMRALKAAIKADWSLGDPLAAAQDCTVSSLHRLRATRPGPDMAHEPRRWPETEPPHRPLYSRAQDRSDPPHSASLPPGPRR